MKVVVFCLFWTLSLSVLAQEQCALGIGGGNDETIAEVFQLNEEQRENLKNWSAELKVRNDILREQAKLLVKRNEESSVEVLMTVSKTYGGILDSMRSNARMIDKRMLSTFNAKQYGFYVELCNKLALRPIHINRPVDEN